MPASSAEAPDPSATASAKGPAYAYKVPQSAGFVHVKPEDFTAMAELLWRRLATQGLTQIFMKTKAGAEGVEVQVLEASAPVVFQARALKKFEAKKLVLAPYVSTGLVDFADGAKLKRPKAMHPHLPFAVECLAGSLDLNDTARFFLKSPLSAPGVPATVASAFWAVLKAQEDEHANMEVRVFTVTAENTTFEVQGEPKARKKPKATPLVVQVPVLINTKAIERGEVLVFTGDMALKGDAEEEE